MAELKEEAKALEGEVKSDYEIVSDLFTKYQQRDISSDAKLVILDDLEYYLHQVIGRSFCVKCLVVCYNLPPTRRVDEVCRVLLYSKRKNAVKTRLGVPRRVSRRRDNLSVRSRTVVRSYLVARGDDNKCALV